MTETEKSDRETLKARAAEMAAPRQSAERPGACADFLVFTLAGERYAVELSMVREVCAGREITLIPGSPLYMAGVANIRGQILPVADLAVFFGMQAEPAATRRVIVLRSRQADGKGGSGKGAEIGILAGSVCGVVPVYEADIRPVPSGGRNALYLGGITGQGLIIFMAERFLDCRDM